MAASEEPFSTSEPGPAADTSLETPASALLAARLGGAIALTAAASLSFNALCGLARHAGLHRLAALLPIAVDAFAASTLFVSYRLPAGHAARRAATRTARLALVLTVTCNGLDHLLDLAGYLLTKHVRDLLLVAVASLPPLIVERLLHLQTAHRRPSESAFRAALTDALIARNGYEDDREAGPDTAVPMSLSTAKRIRALVEERCPAAPASY